MRNKTRLINKNNKQKYFFVISIAYALLVAIVDVQLKIKLKHLYIKMMGIRLTGIFILHARAFLLQYFGPIVQFQFTAKSCSTFLGYNT